MIKNHAQIYKLLQPGEDKDFLAIVLNAAILLRLLIDLHNQETYSSDVTQLERFIRTEISNFHNILKINNVNKNTEFIISYLICSAFDDVFQNRHLYDKTIKKSFLLDFHNEPGTLSRFYEFIDILQSNKATNDNLNIAMIAYLLLQIGYKGKYCNDPDQETVLDHYKTTLYNYINNFKTPTTKLRNYLNKQTISIKRVPIWVIASLTLMLSSIFYKTTDYFLQTHHQSIEKTIETIHTKR